MHISLIINIDNVDVKFPAHGSIYTYMSSNSPGFPIFPTSLNMDRHIIADNKGPGAWSPPWNIF